ncbi:VanZ family protein [Sulfuricurvum sp.]|uniref:VanZ family protein n=1 Tax=Sulfuricurvum sp. TaxID=2025608 RepID=UPI0026196CE8|nr:VanZ family protein [Sulfuricurvum sp.]MDD2781125.1 VanZ family protein [Sulfuricurvum sp.]
MIFFFRTLFFSALISISVLAFLPDYNDLPRIVSLSDLLNHAVAFSVLSILYTFAYSHTPKRITLTLIAYGVLIEVVQAFLPTRYPSFEDIIADSVGIFLGLALRNLIKSSTLFKPKPL